jgi:hypothetical protein
MGMIAYKPYSRAPKEHTPVGIPLDSPWILVEITEGQAVEYVQLGFIVLPKELYDQFILDIEPRMQAWQEARLRLGIEEVVSSASRFGSELMITFAAENVLLGITQEGKTGEVLTKLAGVQLAMQAGSLYEAITRIRAIPLEEYDTKYITEARLLVFINKIEEYLGLPLSTEI